MGQALRSSRVKLRATPEYLKENVNVGKQYKDWFTAGDAGGVEQIKPGEGQCSDRKREDRRLPR